MHGAPRGQFTSGVATERSDVVTTLAVSNQALASRPMIADNEYTGVGTVEASLYERLGGTAAITAVTRAFEDRAAKDDRINQKFARTNLDRLTKEFVDQLCQDTGGPCTYSGRDMKETHANMGVTSGEFDVFMEDLVATLDGFNVGKDEQDELLNLLRPMKREIVEADTGQVGTPLPAAFTPAPPL
jgi:hemoglobin